VAWATGPERPDWRDTGMGIEFLEMEDAARTHVVDHVDARINRYRVRRAFGRGGRAPEPQGSGPAPG
jgi:hypothetical protein